jgi:RNA polymerase sigma-70 factor (ECF subfamily)
MLELLAPDVVAWSDGGGKVTAARRPLVGADHVARWVMGVLAKPAVAGVVLEVVEVNGAPGLVARLAGQPVGAVSLDLVDGLVVGVRFIVNPDKLRGLRP